MEKIKGKKENKKIAVIGIGCRFPGANNLQEYWDLLVKGKCAIRNLPEARLSLEINQTKDNYFRKNFKGGYLDDIDLFDPLFFGITPREATSMDPQHRVLLEVVWEAFEDAGIVVKKLAGSNTGVFVGIGFSGSDYFHHQACRNVADIYSMSGTQSFAAANRISYLFDFRGPSFAIDSACSTSLIAIDEACARIRNGECTIAVAGGANIISCTNPTAIFDKARLLAPDGLCKTFDEKADGYVRSEGVGVVILKSLSKALEDGDSIYAVISGGALNHGGKNGRGFTYPNQAAQEVLLRKAYENSDITPNEVYYIETHGTGTPVGDEIELRGIANVMAPGRKSNDYCMIGAVKTNIGHLEYAAGIASLIKVCLILKEKKIPPSLHFKNLNHNVSFESTPIRVQTSLSRWPKDKKLIAGVSSFGIGGANVHIVLEGIDNYLERNFIAEKDHNKNEFFEKYLFPVTAQNMNALKGNVLNYIKFIEEHRELKLQDLCYSASVKKDHFNHRLAIACTGKEDLSCKLKEFILDKHSNLDIFSGEKISEKSMDVVFAFSDSNEGWLDGEIKEIFKISLFLEVLKEIDKIYYKISQISLVHEINSKNLEGAINKKIISDPFFFSFQVAMSKLWQLYGISPSGLVGYGQGEITAAYISKILTLEDSLKLIYDRAVLLDMHSVSGKMINVMASLEEMESFISKYNHKAYISAINSPTVLTVSGNGKDIETIANHLKDKGYFLKDLLKKHALYCPIMVSIRDKLSKMFQPPMGKMEIPIYVTGLSSSGTYLEYTPKYWEEQITGRIDFANRIRTLSQNGCNNFIEIGDRSLLCFYITDILNDLNQEGLVISSLSKDTQLEQCITRGLAELYVAGYPLNWGNIIQKGSFVKLPNYAWQKRSYWI